MHRNEAIDLLGRLGNHRRRRDVLQSLSDSGLSIDNVRGGASGGSANLLGQLLTGPGGEVGQQVADLSKQLIDLRTVQQSQLDKLNENTQALAQNTLSKASRALGSGAAGGAASNFLNGMLGFSPIFKGILDLFAKPNSQPIAPLTPFILPPSVQYAGGVQQGNASVVPIDYGQGGQPRVLGGGIPGGSATPASIQVNVTAMDSKSFLDHSDDIARAVRQAMLQSSSLNDVITDL